MESLRVSHSMKTTVYMVFLVCLVSSRLLRHAQWDLVSKWNKTTKMCLYMSLQIFINRCRTEYLSYDLFRDPAIWRQRTNIVKFAIGVPSSTSIFHGESEQRQLIVLEFSLVYLVMWSALSMIFIDNWQIHDNHHHNNNRNNDVKLPLPVPPVSGPNVGRPSPDLLFYKVR